MTLGILNTVPLAEMAIVNTVPKAEIDTINGVAVGAATVPAAPTNVVSVEVGVSAEVYVHDTFIGADATGIRNRLPDTEDNAGGLWLSTLPADARAEIQSNAYKSTGAFQDGHVLDLPAADFISTMVLRSKASSYAGISLRNTVTGNANPTWLCRIWTPDLRLYQGATQRGVATSNDPTEGTMTVTANGSAITCRWDSPSDTDLNFTHNGDGENNAVANSGLASNAATTLIDEFKAESL